MREIVRKTYFPGLDLAPANVDVQEWEHQVPSYLQRNRGAPFYRRIQDLLAPHLDFSPDHGRTLLSGDRLHADLQGEWAS